MNRSLITGLIGIVVAGSGAALYLQHTGTGQTATVMLASQQLAAPPGAPVVLGAAGSAAPRTPPAGYAEYRSQLYHFSFFYPTGMQYKEVSEAQGRALLIVFQDSSTGAGFQIYIQPYGPPTITKERFALDEPSGVEKDPFNIAVGGAQGIMFESVDPVIGNIREIWFIHGGFLYEITTAMTFDASMQGIMQSWQFI